MANMGNNSCVFIILSWDITIQYNFQKLNTIENMSIVKIGTLVAVNNPNKLE